MKLHLKILYVIYIYFYSTFAYPMSINPRENLFAQLPQNVLNHIGYFVTIDLITEQLCNQEQSIPSYVCIHKQQETSVDTFDEKKRSVMDENQVFELINKGYHYEGLDVKKNKEIPHYLLNKSKIIKTYNDIILHLAHNEIFYQSPKISNKICIFRHKLISVGINSLLNINQFQHPNMFEFIGYFNYPHVIAIRLLNEKKSPLNNNILIIQLPYPKQAPPFLDDFFIRAKICKNINLNLIMDGQE